MVVCLVTVIGTGQEPQEGKLETASPTRLHGWKGFFKKKSLRFIRRHALQLIKDMSSFFKYLMRVALTLQVATEGVHAQHRCQKIPRMRQ